MQSFHLRGISSKSKPIEATLTHDAAVEEVSAEASDAETAMPDARREPGPEVATDSTPQPFERPQLKEKNGLDKLTYRFASPLPREPGLRNSLQTL